ncbi:hypothetical protein BJ166DRAFT_506181 [Pestalotiopsis sp. NC0098]|nr:hypothetical protein BJ166DRAFT_506181 [Pestalotiopsis sp. NC0098]
MSLDTFYDPDEVVPINSPPLQAIHPRLSPISAPSAIVSDPDIDDYGLDTPWEPSLRVSGRAAIYAPENASAELASPADAVLLDQMCNGRLPYIGWQAQRGLSVPVSSYGGNSDQENVEHGESPKIVSTYVTLNSLESLAGGALAALPSRPCSPSEPLNPREVTQKPKPGPGLSMPVTPSTPNGLDMHSPRIPSSAGRRHPGGIKSPTTTLGTHSELAPYIASPTSEMNGYKSQPLPYPPRSPPGMPIIPGIYSPISPQHPYTHSMPSPGGPLYDPYTPYQNANGYVPRSSQDYTAAPGNHPGTPGLLDHGSMSPPLRQDPRDRMDIDYMANSRNGSPNSLFEYALPSPTPSVAARKRWGIPLSLPGKNGNATVMSCPDSGADDNTMTLEEAQRLGLPMTSKEEDVKEFCLADGKIIRSLGKVISSINFSQGSASADALTTFFYVFQTLVEPIIIGLKFLELSETFSKHRDRLVELDVPQSLPLRVLSIGGPRRNLICRLDEDKVFANADSGSDLDFISEKYATSRNLSITPNKERIMLADGSITTTSGVAILPLSVEDVDSDAASERSQSTVIVSKEFHIFQGMVHDVLIGHGTIEELQVFTRFDSSLLPGLGLLSSSSLNIIRHLKKIPTLKDIKRLIQRGRSSRSQANISPHQNGQEDHWENARRSAEMERDRMSIDHVTNSQIGHFVCTFSGCNAAPFQTQYLLNSHASIHSSVRPHYCPVRGCPRSEGGKGFKRKNEMIRHGLVHESPGYVCPFCPDRDHKYPRPDNLARHVRVHHPDKDKDDPQLREILAQQLYGRNLGRRRRGVP